MAPNLKQARSVLKEALGFLPKAHSATYMIEEALGLMESQKQIAGEVLAEVPVESLTEDLTVAIKIYADRRPAATHEQIAKHFGVGMDKVSEVLGDGKAG